MIKRFFSLFIFLVTVARVWAGTPEEYVDFLDGLYRGTVPLVEPEEAHELISGKEELVILDVRSDEERSVSFLEGSRFHDFDSFELDQVADLDPDAPVLLYCAVGYRSERIGEQLIAAGFTDVQHVYGGIIEWYNRGFDIENGAASADGPTLIHGHEPRWGKYVTDGMVTYEPEVK